MYYKMSVEPRLAALTQIANGLEVRGIIDLIRKNPKGYKDLFLLSKEDLSIERFFEELNPEFSDKGSNKFPLEETTYKHFCDFVEKCFYDGESFLLFCHYLVFIINKSFSLQTQYI